MFRDALADGGATPDSHRRFATLHHPALTRTAFGPPVASSERLLALVDAGVVRLVVGPGGRVETTHDSFVLSSSLPAAATVVHTLVDARIPATDVRHDDSPLLRRLRERGEVAPHHTRGRGQIPYTPGGLRLVPGSGQLIGVDGRVVRGLTATGTPTEGTRYDNDALARDRNDTVTDWAQRVRVDAAARVTARSGGPT